MIDLHCHSYFSDGELSPSALLKKALDAHVKLLALTDHDTIEGLQELHAAAKGCDIAVIDGIELSVRWKKYDIHVHRKTSARINLFATIQHTAALHHASPPPRLLHDGPLRL